MLCQLVSFNPLPLLAAASWFKAFRKWEKNRHIPDHLSTISVGTKAKKAEILQKYFKQNQKCQPHPLRDF